MEKPVIKIIYQGKTSSVRDIKVRAGVDPRDVARILLRNLKSRNPVDTGASRAAWTITYLGNNNYAVENDKVYIQYLNRGTSEQAPSGWVQDAVAETRETIKSENWD